MKTSRKLLFIMITTLIIAVLAACNSSTTGDAEENGNTDSGNADSNAISIATASTSGAWYPLGGAWASLISKNVDGVTATAEVGAASIENVRKLTEGDIELAFMQPDVAYNAYNGSNQFENAKMDGIRSLFATYSTITQIVTMEDSGIDSIDGMKGAKVGVGAPGSGTEVTSRTVLEHAGVTYDDITPEYISITEMIEGLKDHQLDVAMGNMPVPTGSFTDLALQHDMKILPVEGKVRDAFLKGNPYFFESVIPAGSYSGVEEDIPTVAFRGVVYAKDEMSEEQAYNIVKTIWENRSEWKNVHAVTKDINLDTVLQGIPTPLHPGAYKYFKEKEIEIPEELIPPEAQ